MKAWTGHGALHCENYTVVWQCLEQNRVDVPEAGALLLYGHYGRVKGRFGQWLRELCQGLSNSAEAHLQHQYQKGFVDH